MNTLTARQRPEYIRELDSLALMGAPANTPDWLTPYYIAHCMERTDIQQSWVPKTGDWFLCLNYLQLYRINSLPEFEKLSPQRISAQLPAGRFADGGCDVYIPEPNLLENRLN